MSYQLMRLPNFQEDLDMLTVQMPVLGGGFFKAYWDAEKNRVACEMVSALHVVVNQGTKSLVDCPRITHELTRYPHQIDERVRNGTFRTFEYSSSSVSEQPTGDKAPDAADQDAPHLFLEQHRLEDLDGDGFREPWIVTVHADTGAVVRICANFKVDDIRLNRKHDIVHVPRRDYFTHFPFLPDPRGGFYGIGFGRLLLSIGEAINTTLNQLLDAGHLQCAGGGFIGSGLNLRNSELRVQMNKWTNVAAAGQKIRDAIVPHEFAGPSPVLFQLLGMLIDAGKQIASVQDVLTGDTSAQTMQPTTLLALIEQGMKVFTAIIKRLFRSLGQLFEMIYELSGENVDEEAYARINDWQPPQDLIQQLQQAQQQAQRSGQPMPPVPPEVQAKLQRPTMAADYDVRDFDIMPLADPAQITDMQAMAKAQVIEDTAQKFPNVVDQAEAVRRVFMAARIPDADKLIQQQNGPNPLMVAKAQADIAHTKAGSMERLARADKITADTRKVSQITAEAHANAVGGFDQTNQHLDAAMTQAKIVKMEHDKEMAERQQQMQEALSGQNAANGGDQGGQEGAQ
jgi:chaperonin GroES